jgi:DNA-binding SARP family transcriptional activator
MVGVTGVTPMTPTIWHYRNLVALYSDQTVSSKYGDSMIVGSPAALDEALTLWRGTPLAGTAGPWEANIRQVLEEQWLSAQVARDAADLAAGRHADLVGGLLEVVSAYPMDERLVGQLMLALSRTGRTADALAQYRLARRRLLERQGSEPGPLLRAALREILRPQELLARR